VEEDVEDEEEVEVEESIIFNHIISNVVGSIMVNNKLSSDSTHRIRSIKRIQAFHGCPAARCSEIISSKLVGGLA